MRGYWQGSDHWKAPAAYKSYQREWRNPLSFIRTFTRFLDLYLLYHIIGLVVACLTENRQRVGDLLAKTLVVKEHVTDPPKSKAEKKSGLVVVLLAVFIILVLVMRVVIVGIALWYMGVFNLEGASKSFTGFGAVKPMSWAVYDDGSAVITMVSEEGAKLTLTDCSMSMYGDTCGICMLPEDSEVWVGGDFQITVDPSYNCAGDEENAIGQRLAFPIINI